MYVIEVSEDKVSHLADTVGKMLHYGGKAMECIEEMRHGGSHMGFRDDEDGRDYDHTGERGYGRGRYNMRDDEMHHEDYNRMGERYPRERWDEMPPYMDERRGRSPYTGRYIRR